MTEHPQIQADIAALRRDSDRHERSLTELFALARSAAEGIAESTAGIARIEGSIDGAFRAKKISGVLLGAIITAAGSAIVALLIALVKAATASMGG